MQKESFFACNFSTANPMSGKILVLELLPKVFLASQTAKFFRGCVRYIFVSLFCIYKREHFLNKKKCFLFHFESSYRL